MPKFLGTLFLLILIVCGSLSISIVPLGTAQSGQTVNGIISSDAVWTLANSPYIFNGPVAVKENTTLTIEPGVNVIIGDYYLQVNGTLAARGHEAEKCKFFGGYIYFTKNSIAYNEQENYGSILQNTILNQTRILTDYSAVKVDSSLIETVIANGSLSITNNVITGWLNIANGSPFISNNVFTKKFPDKDLISVTGGSPIIRNNVVKGIRINTDGDVIISNNSIEGTVNGYSVYYGGSNNGSLLFVNNSISGSFYEAGNIVLKPSFTVFIPGLVTNGKNVTVLVCSNNISNCSIGISGGDEDSDTTIENNEIYSNNDTGIIAYKATIKNNYIHDNNVGIQINQGSIKNNTVTNNTEGIVTSFAYMNFNNINNNLNLRLQSSSNLTAAYNWWGTTDFQAIDNKIFDFKNDFNLGVVNFTPFLETSNLYADPSINYSTQNPTNSSSNTISPGNIDPFPLFTIVTAVIVLLGAALVIIFQRKRKK